MNSAASPTALPAEAPATRPSAKTLLSLTMALLCLGHMLTDMFSSTIATLQPVLATRYGLSLTQAGLLGGVYMFSSSVLQLPFGIVSDRLNTRMFSVIGPLAAAVFFSNLGLAGGFPMLLALTVLGGLGVAAFHPPSTTHASRLAGERRGLGVAVFITFGTFGLALGPPYFSAIIETFGFDRLQLAMVPALILCALLLWKLPAPAPHPEHHSARIDWTALRRRRGPLALHYGLVVLRSIVQLGIGQFLTLYLVLERGMEMGAASWVLSLFFLAASMGSFLGGSLADSIGGKRVVTISMSCSAPFLLLFVGTTGWLSIASLFVGGLILLMTIPVNVVMAQELVPSQAGAVSALMMGFAWGMAGITFIPAIGWLADHFTLQTVLWGVAAAPLLGVLLALRLPASPAEA